jgi:hypothetical protein
LILVLVSHTDIQRRFRSLSPFLDERMRRLVAAAESEAIGYGGVTAVARATGVSRRAITKGMKELNQWKAAHKTPPAPARIRREGAGRKRAVDKDLDLVKDLDRLIDPLTRGDPESPLRWTCKSVRRLAEELRQEGHSVSYQTVAELLHEMDYSLQAKQKTLEGTRHADRDKQFEFINRKAQRYLKQGEPVISVDTKKIEPVGDFKNVGWVSVGVDLNSAAFAVESIRRWWRSMGRLSYPRARRLLITADSGGSNYARVWLWKWQLQQLSDETALEISVCHFPPGTSKWNSIDHRLFSFTSQTWRGKPLIGHEVIINVIAAATSKAGLTVTSDFDPNIYLPGIEVSDQQRAELRIKRGLFRGDWNYRVLPRS